MMSCQSFKCRLLTCIFLTGGGEKVFCEFGMCFQIYVCKGLETDKVLMKFMLTDKGCFHLL